MVQKIAEEAAQGDAAKKKSSRSSKSKIVVLELSPKDLKQKKRSHRGKEGYVAKTQKSQASDFEAPATNNCLL